MAGSTIAGWRDDCLNGDHSFDANVFHYSTWLKGLGLSSASARCGTGPFIDPDLHVLGAIDTVSDVKAEVVHSLDVRPGIAKLGVAMNAEDNGKAANDFDLYLIQGAVADKAKAVCAEDGPGQFGYCEVKEPAQGPWQIILRRKRGQGAAQITVTQLPR